MELVQARIVTDDVERLAGFYASLAGVGVTLNEYYVEVPADPMSVGFSRRKFTEYREAKWSGRGARSSSTSRSKTSTRSTTGSTRWAWNGSRGRRPSPGETAR